MRRTTRRALAWTIAALVGAVSIVAVLAAVVFTLPPSEPVGKADLIYVIGPPQHDRIAAERALRSAGVADMSLYSVSTHGGWSAAKLPVCRQPNVYCVHPEPFTTKGEIAYLKTFAAEHDVKRTVILTFTPHVARTRFIVDRCFDGDVTVVAVDQHLNLWDWARQYVYQSGALVKAWLTPCADQGDL